MWKLCVLALLFACAEAGVKDGFCVCQTSGRYQYQTFDDAIIRFDGLCVFRLVKTKNSAERKFSIDILNEMSGNVLKRTVSMMIEWEVVVIKPGNKLVVNGKSAALPYYNKNGMSITMKDGTIEVYLAWMLTILFDGKLNVTIKVPASYRGKTFGLCGDCNDNSADDYRLKDSAKVLVKSPETEGKIGESYLIEAGMSPCYAKPVNDQCDANEKCIRMFDTPFKECSNAIGLQSIANSVDSCKIDVCMGKDNKADMCGAFEKLAKKCENKMISVKWKALIGCETPCDKEPCMNNGKCSINATTGDYICTCGKNFVGNNCDISNPCLTTPCKNSGTCVSANMNGNFKCKCPTEWVGDTCEIANPCQSTPCKNSGTCVSANLNGKFVCNCPTEWVGDTCESTNLCLGVPCGSNGVCTPIVGNFVCNCNVGYIGKTCNKEDPCSKNPCLNGATCESTEQGYKCNCKFNFYGIKCEFQMDDCVCRAFGDPHYITFDGQPIHFMGKCKYTLATTKSSSNLTPFSVEVKNHHRGNSRVSYTRLVDLKINGNTFRMLPGGKLMVNGYLMVLPLTKYMEVNAMFSFGWIIIWTDFGLKVEFDGAHRVIVRVSSNYMRQLTGICGDCNLQEDDYKTKSGDDVSTLNNKYSLIGRSYQVVDDSDKPETNCTVVDYAATCTESETKECMNLALTDGVFGTCLGKMTTRDANIYYEACKTDVCAYINSPMIGNKILCQAYEAFAKKCEELGVFTSWRSALGCKKKCGTNEKYMIKSTICRLNCLKLPKKCAGEFGEGCACKYGFKVMGDTCVKSSFCGCSYNGIGIEPYMTTITPNCSNRLDCMPGNRLTVSPGCAANEDCLLQSGKRVCQCSSPFKKDNTKCLVPTFPESEMASALENFVRVTMARIEGTPLKTTSTNRPGVCAVICRNNTNCKSFTFDEMKDECKLFSVNAVDQTLVTANCPFQDYYQLIESEDIVIRGGTIYPCGPLTEYAVVKTLEDCKTKCKEQKCKSMEYSVVNQECSISNSTGKDFEINGDSEFVFYGKSKASKSTS